MQKSGPSVLVIGAGAAGLAAARLLHDSHVDVTVLEARERVGGRVSTEDWDGVPIDMGASWIHGTMGNPVTDLRDQFGIQTVVTDEEAIAFYSGGQRLDPDETEAIGELIEQVASEVDRPTPARQQNASMEAIVAAALGALEAEETQLRGVRFGLYEHFENEWGASPGELSARWFKDTRFEQHQEVFPNGYGQVFTALAQDLDVRYQHVVTSIAYDGGEVAVTVHNGEKLHANYAIITLPLGVLQANSVVFDPVLPPAKTAAIQHLGMGVLSKTWLRFPERFWPEEETVQVLACLGADNVDWSPRWSTWYRFDNVTHQPILCGFNGGPGGRAIEQLAVEQIQGQAMTALRVAFGDGIPDPVSVRQSRWTRDPFARGSYSHVPAGASVVDRDVLADPVGGQLLFAGEATHRTCSQTVHGALLSGWREARRVLHHL